MPSDLFDIKLTIGSTTMPLQLAQQNGAKMWSVQELDRGIQETDKLFEQTDWSGGFGDGVATNPMKFGNGQGIDTTEKGQFMLGPAFETLQASNVGDSYTSSDDAGVEITAITWRAQTFTTTSAYTVTDVRLKFYRTGSPSTVTVGIYATAGSLPTGAALVTGTMNGNSVTTSVSGEWYTISLGSGTALANATEYAIVVSCAVDGLYWRTDLGNGYAGGQAASSTNSGSTWNAVAGSDRMFFALVFADFSAAIVDMVYMSGYGVVCATALSIYLYSETNGYWSVKKTYGAGDNITDLEVYESKLYIARGASTAYEYSADLSTFTTISGLSDLYATYFVVNSNLLGTGDVLWKAVAGSVKSNDNPIVGGSEWSSAYPIGDTTTSITGLMIHNNQLYIGKSDGLYLLDADASVLPLLPELKLAQSTNNFKYHTNYKGSLYFSLDTRIGEISSYSYYDVVDPYQNLVELDTEGSCVALTSDRDYLYAFMYDGTNYTCYKGFKNPDGSWSWCPWIHLGTTAASAAYVFQVPGYSPYLWFNYGTASANVYLTDSPLADSSYKFGTTGYLQTGWFDAGSRDWVKLLEAVNCECRASSGDLSATISVTCYYEVDESGTWVAIDSAYTDNNSATTKKYLDASTLANGKKVRFKILLASDNSAITPVVKYFSAYGQVRPLNRKVYDFYIDIDPRNKVSKTIRDFLEGGRDSTALITLNDRFGTDHYVEMLPGYPKQTEIYDTVSRQSSLICECRMIDIDWS